MTKAEKQQQEADNFEGCSRCGCSEIGKHWCADCNTHISDKECEGQDGLCDMCLRAVKYS